MTAAQFRAMFAPAFDRAPDALVETRLAWAEARTPVEIWGDLQEQGVAWLAAHFVAIAPGAKDMRKGGKASLDSYDSTPYGQERKRLNRTVSAGYRVAGSAD